MSILTQPDELHYLANVVNWDIHIPILVWIVKQAICSEATALMIFWQAQPQDYIIYKWNTTRIYVQMYKPYRCKEGIYSYIPAKSFKPSRKIEENMIFSYSLFLSNIPHYDGKKKDSSQTDKTIFVSYRKEVYIALEKHLKEKK
ncbi:DUF4274 domain-containing protein [Parabacteroides sp. APC149_11_2_Y6]